MYTLLVEHYQQEQEASHLKHIKLSRSSFFNFVSVTLVSLAYDLGRLIVLLLSSSVESSYPISVICRIYIFLHIGHDDLTRSSLRVLSAIITRFVFCSFIPLSNFFCFRSNFSNLRQKGALFLIISSHRSGLQVELSMGCIMHLNFYIL